MNAPIVILSITMIIGSALSLCPHPRFVEKHLCTGSGVACGDSEKAQEGKTGKTAALQSQMNKDPYQNAVKILINSGCAPDLRVPQKRNFRSGSPRTITCAPLKNLSNLPDL